MPYQPVPKGLILPESPLGLKLNWIEEEDFADLPLAFAEDDYFYFPMRPQSNDLAGWQTYIDICSQRGLWLMVARETEGSSLVCLTSFMDYQPQNLGVEIGHTLVIKSRRGTWVNPSIKLALMTCAFEAMNLIRVQFKAHARNERSRGAIEKIGGTYEGTLRQNTKMPDGSWRDTAYYSVLKDEWPHVKQGLQALSTPRA